MRRWNAIIMALAMLFPAVPARAISPYYLFFEPGSARLNTHAIQVLEDVTAAIRTMQVEEIEIVGAADRVGSETSNMALSRRRAEAVRAALRSRGMSPAIVVRITATGESMPLVETADGVAEAQNRHAYILLVRFAPTTPLLRQDQQ